MNVIFLGDVFGDAGVAAVRKNLWNLRKEYKADFVIVNGENCAPGNGTLPDSADALFEAGADVLTGGNHSLQRQEILPYMDDHECVLRPANMPAETPGRGMCFYETDKGTAAVISIMGYAYMEHFANPFDIIDALVDKAKQKTNVIIIDFHAETTSEKRVMAEYLNGKVSAVLGTHTHVQTADEQIIGDFTGFISDAGMCGVKNSVIGLDIDGMIGRLVKHNGLKPDAASGPVQICGVFMRIDEHTGRCLEIERIKR